MTRQAAETAAALLSRLNPFLDTNPKAQVEASVATWPNGLGADIADIHCLMIHATEGWPTRDKADSFVRLINGPGNSRRGYSPHFYISNDGTVFQIFAENRQVWHGVQMNDRCIGVETGNLLAVGAPGGGAGNWGVPTSWMPLTAAAEDIPGAKMYICHPNAEVIVCYWSTARPNTPDGSAAGNRMMLFNEAQYRSWRLLARYLAEVWRIPRHVPLRPHMRRGSMAAAARSEVYRKIVNADPVKEVLLAGEIAAAPFNYTTYDADDEAAFRAQYERQIHTEVYMVTLPNGQPEQRTKSANHFWKALLRAYRGFLSHAYPGAIRAEDHNCPGALFDFDRFARDLWDYWWFPFDLAAGANPADPPVLVNARRDYGHTDPALLEYYWDSVPARFSQRTTSGFFGIGEEILTPAQIAGLRLMGFGDEYFGFWHGGMHFQLAADTPIYAAAGGQVVAARFPDTYPAGSDRDAAGSALASTRFVLIRHEIFHERAAGGNRLNYDAEPSYVYSLYMHLGAPTGMSYANVVYANPVWLNKLLMRKKECDAGLTFHTAHPNPAAHWRGLPDRWRREQPLIDGVLNTLQAGQTAVFPEGDLAIHLSLGDFLGNAGHYAPNVFAIHFEVLSNNTIDAAHFPTETVNPSGPFYDTPVMDRVTAFINPRVRGGAPIYRQLRVNAPDYTAGLFSRIALQFKSEWALTAADFPHGGWAANQPFMWWQDVVPTMNANADTPAAAQLPADGNVRHYHPLGFMARMNELTWASELSKHRLPSPSAVDVRPPRRR